MTTIYDQLALEHGMVQDGKARSEHGFNAAEKGGRGGDTTYSRILMKELLPDLIDHIQEVVQDKNARRFGKYKKLLTMIDCDRAAYLALRGVFQKPFTDWALPTLAKHIGGTIEDEIKFTLFQEDHTDYYNAIIKDFKSKAVTSYRHRKRVLTYKLNERDVQWRTWTQDEKLHVGMILLDCIISSTDLLQRAQTHRGNKTTAIVRLTTEASDWIKKHKDRMGILTPTLMPCIVKPDDWIDLDIGGYYTPELRKRTPLVKTRSRDHLAILRDADLTEMMQGVNRLQETSWRINSRVHEVIKDIWKKDLRIGMGSPNPIDIPKSPVAHIPKENFTEAERALFDTWRKEASRLHTKENDRIKKNFQVLRVLKSAQDYAKYDKFWYVYQADFRGRFYAATAGLSPQGPDIGRGLIEFSEPKMMGDRGFYWMKVHFSNLRGHDKVPYDDRAAYTDTFEKEILDFAQDPLGRSRHLWVDSDKPFCTLAALFELADAYSHGAENTPNRIAVAKDGSCNGLQHYAALLRDKVGAAATNVTFENMVADIYSRVGVIAMERVLADKPEEKHEALKDAWLEHLGTGGVPRKLAKKPVMTLPYGSTQRSCTDSVIEYINSLDENTIFEKDKVMQYSTYMTKHLWCSIGEVVTSARDAMKWLQTSASTLAKEGHALVWVTPTGFPVHQASNKIDIKRISTQLGGDLKITVGSFNDEINPRKQASGASPNFVHSFDGCHLLMTVLLGEDLDAWAVIHDSYGTYAADTDKLDYYIRQAFIDLYHDRDHLQDFKRTQEARTGVTLTEPPEQGDLCILDVRNSPYFFG